MINKSPPDRNYLEEYFNHLDSGKLSSLANHYLIQQPRAKEKRDIIHQLILFLKQPEHQDRMVALLDKEDILLLTAIDLLPQLPSHPQTSFYGTLTKLLYPMKKYQVEVSLQNLKDRLWIYHHYEHDQLEINPYLHHAISDKLQISTIFPQKNISQATISPRVSLALIQAMLTFMHQNQHQVISIANINQIFQHQIAQIQLEEIIRALQALNIITEHFHLKIAPLKELLKREPHEQLAEIYASILLAHTPHLHNQALKILLAHLFITPHALHYNTIIRLYALHVPEFKASHAQDLLHLLEYYTLIVALDEPNSYYNHVMLQCQPLHLKIEGNLTFFHPYDQPMHLAIILSCKLLSYDIFSQYELAKKVLVNTISQWFTKEDLNRFFLQHTHIPSHLMQTIEYWLKEDTPINIYQGYILHLTPTYKHLLQNNLFMERFVETLITQEILLLRKDPDQELEDFLSNLGAPPPTLHERVEEITSALQPSSEPYHYVQPFIQARSEDTLIEHTTDNVNLPLPQNASQRILLERKLILSEEQLIAISPFKQQASGIDFQAKIRLVDLALKEKKDLLLQVQQTTGEQEFYIQPISYDKKDSQRIKAYDYRLKQLVHIPIKAIGHLEVITRSLLQ